MVGKFLRGWLACVLFFCMMTDVIQARDRLLAPITTTTTEHMATVPAATSIPMPLLAAPASNVQTSTWHPLHPVVIVSMLWLLAVFIFLISSAPQPRRWDLGFPHLFVTALVYLLGIATVALLAYLVFPALASGVPAKLATPISAGGTLLLIVLLAAKELVPATDHKGKAIVRGLNIALLPLWVLFLITVVSRLLALVQF